MRGYLLTQDLFFSSKIAGSATALGHALQTVMSIEALAVACEAEPPALLVIDLQTPNLHWDRLRSLAGDARMVAFGPHINTTAFEAAQIAGCDEVLPRSKLSAQLPTLLTRWFSPDR